MNMSDNRITVGISDDEAPNGDSSRSRPVQWAWAGVSGVVIAGLTLFGAFGGSDPTSEAEAIPPISITKPTATTLAQEVLAALEYESDVDLINELWWDYTNAWTGGFESGVQFWVDNNYPDMGCAFDDYMNTRFPDGPVQGLLIERIANSPTIELDDDWIIPGGRLRGVPALGRVYIMRIRQATAEPDVDLESPILKDVHVTILGGRAHFFFGCS